MNRNVYKRYSFQEHVLTHRQEKQGTSGEPWLHIFWNSNIILIDITILNFL